MMLIMLPLMIRLVLFYVRPLSSALPTYLVLLFFSGVFHLLMRKSMKLPVATGKSLIGLPVTVLSRKGRSGQARVHGEAWEASTRDGKSLEDDEELVVAGIQGLTLIVESPSGAQPAEDSSRRRPRRDDPSHDAKSA